ncbi:MAG: hypothetical protein IJD45_03350 [Clostridia bacterium]|nr:hypothetical protein [Clostridia bacterium]
MNSILNFFDYIFPAMQAIIGLVALAGAILNIVMFLKLIGKAKAILHLASAVVLLLLSALLFIWFYKAYLLGFHY